MNKALSSYYIQLLVLAAVFIALYSFLQNTLAQNYYSKTWLIVTFIVTMFSVFHYGLGQSLKKDAAAPVRYIMMAMGIKLFVSLIVIVVYLFLHGKSSQPFIISFLVCYFTFMAFDTAKSYALLRK